MSANYTNNLRTVMNYATRIAMVYRLGFLASEHLLFGLVSCEGSAACKLLGDSGLSRVMVKNELDRTTSKGTATSTPECTPNTNAILKLALTLSVKAGVGYVSTEHLLLALLYTPDCRACSIIRSFGIDCNELLQKVSTVVFFNRPQNKVTSVITEGDVDEESETTQVDNSPVQREKVNSTSTGKNPLEGFGVDLTLMAKRGQLDPVIGREIEIQRVISALSRRTKNSPVLVGEAGVGKSAVVEGLAQAIVNNQVPDSLAGKRIFSMNLSGVIAGAKYRGEFEERFKKTIDFLKEDKNTILFIDEIHNLVGTGATNDGMDAAEMIKPELARGELQVIGATTVDEYRKYIEADAALERRFQPITVNPPTPEQAKLILKGLRSRYEGHHKVRITDEAINAAVDLSERYITDRNLPDKAIDLIDEAAANARISATATTDELTLKKEQLEKLLAEKEYCADMGDNIQLNIVENKIMQTRAQIRVIENNRMDARASMRYSIGKDDIAKVISMMTNIPLTRIETEESQRLMQLEQVLHSRVIGQEEAVNAVSRAIRRARSNLKDPKRPNGSFIFVGPTGVGKTELSKALAEAVYGDEKALIRIDMSEYMQKHDVSKLIGAPPGFVGFEEEGQLSERVRKNPYSLVLFDEIEKAHADIFNLLLQILDDGRLTDSKGRLVDFKNTIIIMTSNIGAGECEKRSQTLGFGASTSVIDENDVVFKALKKHFRPEFLNRVDEIVPFRKLTKEECGKIVRLLLAGLEKRLKEMNVALTVDASAERAILERGYDPEYGARPLKRTIQREVEDMLSNAIITGRLKSGAHIKLYGEDQKVRFVQIN